MQTGDVILNFLFPSDRNFMESVNPSVGLLFHPTSCLLDLSPPLCFQGPVNWGLGFTDSPSGIAETSYRQFVDDRFGDDLPWCLNDIPVEMVQAVPKVHPASDNGQSSWHRCSKVNLFQYSDRFLRQAFDLAQKRSKQPNRPEPDSEHWIQQR